MVLQKKVIKNKLKKQTLFILILYYLSALIIS